MTSPRFQKKATLDGTYWTSPVSSAELKRWLRDRSLVHFKLASLGGEQESGFEQAFSSLGYAYLKDKSPRLLDFIVGFQLVDRNEDNTKAVGIFGFKVGDQWLYAPVFFLNGDLKGHELLYLKNKDLFVPMKENWVNYLIARRPHRLGEASPQSTYELGGRQPDFRRFSYPPTTFKYSSDAGIIRPHLDEWVTPFLPFLGAVATRNERLFTKQAGLGKRLDLRDFLVSLPLLKLAFDGCYCAYPLLKRGFERFYGPGFFRQALSRLKAEEESLVKRAGSYLVPPKRKDKVKKPSPYLITDKEEVTKRGAVEILVSDDVTTTQNLPELTESEREKLLGDTVLIRDHREGEQVSKAYDTQVRMELSNPPETGLYEVLEKPGSFDRMLVLVNPQTGRGRENFSLVVRLSDPRSWLNTHRTNLWVKPNGSPDRDELKTWVEGLGGTKDLKKGGTYVAVHANGSGTCPFRVRESYEDNTYRVEWESHCRWRNERPEGLPPVQSHTYDHDPDYSSWDALVQIKDRPGTGLRSTRGQLVIPADFKILKVKDPPKPKRDKDSLVSCCQPSKAWDDTGSDPKPIQPGNLVDVQLFLHEKTAQLRLIDLGASEIYVNSRLGHERMTKKAALLSMVRDHGLSEGSARVILREAARAAVLGHGAVYRVKYAQGYPSLQPGPGAPAFPEPQMGMEQAGPGAYPAIYSQEEFLPVPGMEASQTDPSIYDPFYLPDQNSMQVAQQAAQSGQKEVFDTAIISGMLKSVRQDALVDRYLGDLMKALDKIGRILFMFYWHQEEFEDRYGKQDLPELEDSLRNAFETLGDVTLFLKEKTVQGQAGIDFSGVGSQSDKGEPSIEEAARN